jgi:hypothetical protein
MCEVGKDAAIEAVLAVLGTAMGITKRGTEGRQDEQA